MKKTGLEAQNSQKSAGGHHQEWGGTQLVSKRPNSSFGMFWPTIWPTDKKKLESKNMRTLTATKVEVLAVEES